MLDSWVLTTQGILWTALRKVEAKLVGNEKKRLELHCKNRHASWSQEGSPTLEILLRLETGNCGQTWVRWLEFSQLHRLTGFNMDSPALQHALELTASVLWTWQRESLASPVQTEVLGYSHMEIFLLCIPCTVEFAMNDGKGGSLESWE